MFRSKDYLKSVFENGDIPTEESFSDLIDSTYIQQLYIGTTLVPFNRVSSDQLLTGVSISGNAETVSNGIYTNLTYSNPSWITSIDSSKLSGYVLNSQLASGGTPSSTTYLSGDRTWKTLTSGSGATVFEESLSSETYYPTFTNSVSGAMTIANISNSKLTFQPSTGTLYSTIFNSSSDLNLKYNIKTISNSIDIVNQLRGVTFNWNDTNEKSSGVIAQELEMVLPELVSTDNNGIKSVNYNGLIGYLIESIKELALILSDQPKSKELWLPVS